MEAAERGPIACLQDGDRIVIDIPGHKLEVRLSKEEIKKRLAELPAFQPKITTGYLARYAIEVTSVSTAPSSATFSAVSKPGSFDSRADGLLE